MKNIRLFVKTAVLMSAVLVISGEVLAAECNVPRVAKEYSEIKEQRAKCEKDDSLGFCEAAEDYQPLMTDDEANAAWQCLVKGAVVAGFAGKPAPADVAYKDWKRYSSAPYQSAHINRFVDDETSQSIYVINYANEAAKNYGKYEQSGPMIEGSLLAKYSMVISGERGVIDLSPIYTMEKVAEGKLPKTKDWKYDLIAPNGLKLAGKELDLEFSQELCAGCHLNFGAKTNSMLFMPEEVRVTN